jgi:hypothetical protein
MSAEWAAEIIHYPSSRRKPGPIKLVKREQRRPADSIQGVPAFAAMTIFENESCVKAGG